MQKWNGMSFHDSFLVTRLTTIYKACLEKSSNHSSWVSTAANLDDVGQ